MVTVRSGKLSRAALHSAGDASTPSGFRVMVPARRDRLLLVVSSTEPVATVVELAVSVRGSSDGDGVLQDLSGRRNAATLKDS